MKLYYRQANLLLVIVVLVSCIVLSHQQESPACGQPWGSTTSRIVGGSESKANQFPWMAYLQIKFWSGDTATCGGTFISQDWVLTAAHCLYGGVNVSVTLGVHDTSNSLSSIAITVSPQSFNIHPDFVYGKVEDDIALIRLPYAIPLYDTVQPVCLPFASDSDQVNDPVVVTGWGNFSSTVDSGLSTVLRKMNTTVISSSGTNGLCQQTAAEGPFSGDKIICSDGSQLRRYCYGDDGGPMNFYNKEWNRWFVIGVAGRGDASVNCQNNKPNLFVRVRGYLNWIGGITGLKPITTTTTTTTTTTKPPTTIDSSYFDCNGKPDGNYANPASSCSTTFYMCSNGYAYLFTCAQAGTVYRAEISACDWPHNVAGCNHI